MKSWGTPMVGLAVALGCLTGCAGTAPSATVGGAAPASATVSSVAPSAPATGASTSAPSPTPAGTRGPGAGEANGSRCSLGELRASVGPTTGGSGQRRTAIVWTNTSGRTCTMTGFGGVDLKGPDDPKGPTFSLPRAERTASTVTLTDGDTAHTTITWLPSDGPWTPTTILATPPDETQSAVLPWPGGAVLRQDGATRPGTYIGPVSSGSADRP